MVGHYPLRMSRPSWDIRLYSKHECSTSCRYECVRVLNEDFSVDLVLRRRQDLVNDMCALAHKQIRSHVSIHSFEPENPMCIDGPLQYADELVIPDERITIYLDMPVTTAYEAIVTARTPHGFTLKEIMTAVRDCYRELYSVEESTAPQQTFHLSKMCLECVRWNAEKKVDPCSPKSGDECTICFSAMESGAARTKCGHVFHADCLLEWMNHGLNCPICRTPLRECSDCNGTYMVYFDYTGAVIPPAHRGILRNDTQGRYGIHSFYLEDISVHSLHYDRVHKRLSVRIAV